MKKWVIRIGAILLALLLLSFLFREQIVLKLMESQLAPEKTFANYTEPEAPVYGTDKVWAALPSIEDPADYTPTGFDTSETGLGVPVFFLHPTTYMSKDGWNGPLDDKAAKAFIDTAVLPGQASSFAGCCDIYAPYYRQATLWTGWDKSGSGELALGLAYEDVSAAFSEFLERIDREPFILAGHSQGSHHLMRLLDDRVSGTELKDRLVVAYAVGYGVNAEEFASQAPDIPICTSPRANGCYVSWNSLGSKAKPWPDYVGAVCVNPLTWRDDIVAAPADQNPGSLSITGGERFERGVSGAVCRHDRLEVGDFQSDMFDNPPVNMGPGNYHLLDYALFYTSIRQNVSDRAAEYLKNASR